MAGTLGGATILRERENRAFGAAVCASLVLHALLLFVFPGLRESQQRPSIAPGPIVARLVSPGIASAPALAEERPQERRVEEPPAPPAVKPLPAPAPTQTTKSIPAPKQPAPAAKPSPSAPSAEAVRPSAEAAPSAPSGPAAPSTSGPVARAEPQPTAPAPAADDAGTLAQYRLALIAIARKYKRYPRVAMDNNWEGTAEIEMVIGANGTIAALKVRASAGHEVLDQQALDMFKRAKPLVPIPAALRGKEFTVVLRAIYSLKEPES